MARACIGLGSNVGPRRRLLTDAVKALARLPGTRLIDSAPPIETDPVGPAQPRYLNSAVLLETSAAPKVLAAQCHAVENALGRDRRHGQRWGPRTIDIDLLLYDNLVMNEPDLTLPHPEVSRRWFVLAPLAAVAPGFVHPLLKRTVAQLLAELEVADR